MPLGEKQAWGEVAANVSSFLASSDHLLNVIMISQNGENRSLLLNERSSREWELNYALVYFYFNFGSAVCKI